VLTDGKGVPLATIVSEANRTDMKRLEELLDARLIALPPLPEDTPDEERPQLCLDRGYDYDACRATARAHGYVPHIPPKSSAAQPLPPPGHPDRHPPRRWVVEVAHSWFNRFRRLLIRSREEGPELPGPGPTRCRPHYLSQAAPCPPTFGIACKCTET